MLYYINALNEACDAGLIKISEESTSDKNRKYLPYWALTEWQKEIDSYLIGATRLYGFVTPKQFLLVFNRYQ